MKGMKPGVSVHFMESCYKPTPRQKLLAYVGADGSQDYMGEDARKHTRTVRRLLRAALAAARAEALEEAAKLATPEWLRAAYYYTNPDTAERDHHRAPDISAWRNVAAAIRALAREAAKEDRS